MARRSRRRRVGRRRKSFGGVRSRGFIPAGTVPLVAGIVGGIAITGWLGPKLLANQAWAQSNQWAMLGATAAIGFGGYMLLKRYNRPAAVALLAATVAIPLGGYIVAQVAGGGFVGPPSPVSGFRGGALPERGDDGDSMNGVRGGYLYNVEN